MEPINKRIFRKRDSYKLRIDHPATAARGLMFISAVVSHSLAYDANDVMNKSNFAIAVDNHVFRTALIGMIRKWLIELMVLVLCVITLQIAQRNTLVTTQ